MDEVVRTSGLTKRFGDVTAVDGIDLVVRAGERVALLGPNGAGKTTTLLMLLGVVGPDEGWIEVAGHRLPKGRSAASLYDSSRWRVTVARRLCELTRGGGPAIWRPRTARLNRGRKR